MDTFPDAEPPRMPSANHITCYKKAKRYTGRVTHVRERTAQPQPNNIPGLYKRYVMVYWVLGSVEHAERGPICDPCKSARPARLLGHNNGSSSQNV